MSHLTILKKNEVYLQIDSDPHVFYELSDQFTFELPGAKFMPQYRKRYWDGKIRLFNVNTTHLLKFDHVNIEMVITKKNKS